jgi:hypothetical protein
MLIYALEVDSLGQAARGELPFVPVTSPELGTPIRIFVSDPAVVSPQDRAVNLIYEHPTYGRFALIEQLSQTTQTELEALAGCDLAKGCEGSWSVITIKGATKALLIVGPGSTSVTWLAGDVRFDLLGPPETFSREEAIAVDNAA